MQPSFKATLFFLAYLAPSLANMKGSYSPGNLRLVQHLKSNSAIVSQRVYDAMLAVDRKHYVNSAEAYEDHPVHIGFNVTISAPHMHAIALERLVDNIKPGSRVLDVGSGSGYLTACMAKLMRLEEEKSGALVGIEVIPELVEQAKRNIAKESPELLKLDNMKILHSNGYQGGPSAFAPYHAIHVGAAADKYPQVLVDQLGRGGKMVIPMTENAMEKGGMSGNNRFGKTSQYFYEISRDEEGVVTTTKLFGVAYVPLKEPGEL